MVSGNFSGVGDVRPVERLRPGAQLPLIVVRLAVFVREADVKQRTAGVRDEWNERRAADELMIEIRPRLLLGDPVVEITDVPDQVAVGQVTEPFDAIGKERNGVGECEPLDGPAIIAGHHLVEACSFLAASDEEIAPQLRNPEHEAGLTDEPLLGVSVIHETGLIREPPFGLEAPAYEDAGITNLDRVVQRNLFLAR